MLAIIVALGMKFICTVVFIALTSISAKAQKYVPLIKPGTVLSFQAHSNALGQSLPLTMIVLTLDGNQQLQWALAGFGTGKFTITATAVENGNKIGFKQPDPDDDTKLKDNETLITISKATFKDMTTNKSFVLNSRNFTVGTDTTIFMINQKTADIIYAADDKGKTKLWILNNPAFPLICKLTGGPQGIDLTLTGVKE